MVTSQLPEGSMATKRCVESGYVDLVWRREEKRERASERSEQECQSVLHVGTKNTRVHNHVLNAR